MLGFVSPFLLGATTLCLDEVATLRYAPFECKPFNSGCSVFETHIFRSKSNTLIS